MLLNVENLDFSYGVNQIFSNVNFRIDNKEKVGLIGKNGVGKSTFIKLLTNELIPDSGKIDFAPFLNIGYLEQISSLNENMTIGEIYLNEFTDIIEKENRLREIEDLFEKTEGDEFDSLLHEYGELQEFFSDSENLSYQKQIREIIVGLGFTLEDLNKRYKDFSGGEKTKLNLGILLLRKPDLLLLDEPTNFLDISAITWLENLLRSYNGSLLITSHDRYFLDKVCNRIDEVEDYKINSYSGNYSNYLEKKTKILADKEKAYKNIVKEVDRQKKILQRYKDINSIQSNKHAHSREKLIQKIEIPDSVKKEKSANINFQTTTRSGDDVLTVSNLSKSFGDKLLFENLNFEVKRAEKIGIIGENGIGKSTLFNILRKREPKNSGDIEFGTKVITGWYDQETTNLDLYDELNLIEVIQEENPLMDDGEIRNYLASFLFIKDDVFKKVKDLSGGEKARIKLALLMLTNSNFLVMDEPTNHIDMTTKEILEEALINYVGTLLVISHDRYFLNKVANKIFEFTSNGINQYIRDYNDYIKQKEDIKERENLSKPEENLINKTQQRKFRKKKKEEKALINSIKREIKELENQIEETEERISEYESLMSESDFYNSENSVVVIKEYNDLKASIPLIEEKWEEKLLELEEKEAEFS